MVDGKCVFISVLQASNILRSYADDAVRCQLCLRELCIALRGQTVSAESCYGQLFDKYVVAWLKSRFGSSVFVLMRHIGALCVLETPIRPFC